MAKAPPQPASRPSNATLRERLRDAGLRATGARVAVLRTLMQANVPMSHAEVHAAVADDGSDRATTYRNLMDLAEIGLVKRSDVGDHTWRFELVDQGDHGDDGHAHFVCADCGAVACLPDTAVEVHAVSGAPRALRDKGVEIQVRGKCDACVS